MLTNENITFNDMATRYGEITAWHYLVEIERAARIQPQHYYNADPEVRLSNALRAQDAMKNEKRLKQVSDLIHSKILAA